MAKRQRLEVTVKETVDYMYALLADQPDGVVYSVNRSLGNQAGQIVTILVKRGIIGRTCIASGNGNCYRYRWSASSAPTKVLYGSVAQELRDKWKKKAQDVKEKKEAAKKARPVEEHEPVVKQEPKQIPEEEIKALDELREKIEPRACDIPIINNLGGAVPMNPLEIYGIDELWAEIKRRGCFIEDNQLVLVKKIVFD